MKKLQRKIESVKIENIDEPSEIFKESPQIKSLLVSPDKMKAKECLLLNKLTESELHIINSLDRYIIEKFSHCFLVNLVSWLELLPFLIH